MTSPARFSGAVVSYVVVAVLLLRASLELGLVVLLGVPLLVATLGLVVRPLQRRQTAQREESGRLIGLGADTVAGLRVLRGIGGEQEFLQRYAVQSRAVRDSGFRVAGFQATLDAAQVLLPGLFVIVVTWLGARFAIDGRITPGQLVAFYGYSAFLVYAAAHRHRVCRSGDQSAHRGAQNPQCPCRATRSRGCDPTSASRFRRARARARRRVDPPRPCPTET
ncbi:MAG: ABC transporter transmembrane domain-containing protein [Dermatophilaceae bacterium]